MTLPPGQRALDHFPRFGAHFNSPPPSVPADPLITVCGAVRDETAFAVADLATLPRTELTADFNCVAGWSAVGLHWEGVGFHTFYARVIQPALLPDTHVTHFGFVGLDGYRSIAVAEDVLADDVLIADRLNGAPLDGDHGAPVRLVSPKQYGFMSTKHLSRVEVYTTAPKLRYHRSPLIQFGLELVKPHPRARVWHEERHALLPAPVVRPIYRLLIGPLKRLSHAPQRDAPSPAPR